MIDPSGQDSLNCNKLTQQLYLRLKYETSVYKRTIVFKYPNLNDVLNISGKIERSVVIT